MRPTAPGRPAAPDRPRDDFPAHDPRIDLLLVHAVHDALRRDVRHLVTWSRTCFPVATPEWVAFRDHLAGYLHADAAVLWTVLRTRDLPGPGHAHAAADMDRARRRIALLAATVDDCLTGRGPASRTAEYAAELAAALTAS
ncbi:MAG: hypothetical protein HOV68_24045, partial [Streptomycetaceae bacterium]|nr:hypothetical protein [Streptomycetaceae bacterium]